MGRIAKEEKCQFMLVCGDAFESNQVDRKTVARALEALKDVPVPVYILPGNHDPLNAASVYRSSTFIERKPAHVHVIENAMPLKVADDVEMVGAPWMSKRPVANPVEEALSTLSPASGITRICMAHGAVDQLTPDPESAGIIAVAALERAIGEGKVHFVALGDRHSLTKVGAGERIWYSGTPEATDFSETRSGFALVVEVGDGRVATKEVQTGKWRFIERERVDLNTGGDVEALRKALEEIENKERDGRPADSCGLAFPVVTGGAAEPPSCRERCVWRVRGPGGRPPRRPGRCGFRQPRVLGLCRRNGATAPKQDRRGRR